MADTQPQVKVPRAKLYKMISYKGTTGGAKKYTSLSAANAVGQIEADMGNGFTAITKGMNSLGATMNGIALQVEGMTEAMKVQVSKQIQSTDQIVKVQKDATKEETQREKLKVKDEERRRKKEARDESEESAEKGGLFKKIREQFKESTKKAAGGLFSGLARLAKFFLTAIVAFGVLDWLANNPEKIQALAKTLAAFGKAIFKITSFLAGSALDGLVSFLENPISIKGFLGAIQFVLSAAPLFVGMMFLKNPIGTIRAFAWVIGTLGKSVMGMFKAGKMMGKMRAFSRNKFAKVGMALGAGSAAAMLVSSQGGSTSEVLGAGVGAGAGQAIGAQIGAATGVPGMGMLLGAAGAAVGGKAGQGIGKLLEPITKPIGRFFTMIGDVFNSVMAPIKETFKGFFEALGGFMNGILDAVEPHLPLITKILGTGIQVMFAPLFLGIKALTAVLKFFTPKKSKKGKDGKAIEAKSKARGGPVNIPQIRVPEMADGGITAGPISFVATTIAEVTNLAKGLREMMLLPFKAIGYGIVSAIGFIGNTFASFLPGPLKSILGAALAPIAAIFGIPLSALKTGGTKSIKGDETEKDPGAEVAPEEDLDSKILESFTKSGDGIMAILVNIAKALSFKSRVEQGLETIGDGVSGFFGGVKNFFGFSEGGAVQPTITPGFANGGWIQGPHSGYPVSLDGGQSVSFIGHGTEWVGMKGFAGGGAFVVPFDTPATRKNSGLTGMRMREASAGGYAMPFSMGGALKTTIPKFEAGGKFDPKAYNSNSNDKVTRGLVLDDKTYYVKYNADKEGNVKVKQVNKRVKAPNLLGIGEKLTSVQPGSDEFNNIVASEGLKESVMKTMRTQVGQGRSKSFKAYPLKEISVHPQADIAYKHNQSYQQNKAAFIEAGVKKKHAESLAARAAMEFAMPGKDDKVTTTAVQRGELEENIVVNADGETADELKPPSSKKDGDKDGDNKQKSPMQLLEAALTKFGDAMSGKALSDAELKKSEAKADKQKAQEEAIKTATETNASAGVGNANTEVGNPIVQGPGAGNDIPIPIRGLDKLDADMFLMPRFGLVTESNQDMVDLN